jgi:hypothetical protein
MGVTWTGNDLFENHTEDVRYDLQKELADVDGLGPEVLHVDSPRFEIVFGDNERRRLTKI